MNVMNQVSGLVNAENHLAFGASKLFYRVFQNTGRSRQRRNEGKPKFYAQNQHLKEQPMAAEDSTTKNRTATGCVQPVPHTASHLLGRAQLL